MMRWIYYCLRSTPKSIKTLSSSYLIMELYSGLYLNMGGPIPDFCLSLMAWYAGAFSLTTVRKLEVSRFMDY
jgi:hypothetical protein